MKALFDILLIIAVVAMVCVVAVAVHNLGANMAHVLTSLTR